MSALHTCATQLPNGRPHAPRPDIAARADAAAASAAEVPQAMPMETRLAGSTVTWSAGEMPPSAVLACAAGAAAAASAAGAVTAATAAGFWALLSLCAAVPFASFEPAVVRSPAARPWRPLRLGAACLHCRQPC